MRRDAQIGGALLESVDATASSRRPVLLGTLSVRFDARAERMAVESAAEVGAPLIIANMLVLRPYPVTVMMCPEWSNLPHEEDLAAVRATAERACAAGVRTQLLRISTLRPVAALLELAVESEAALLVFGPDRTRLKPRRWRGAVRALSRRAPCLVWFPDD